MTGPPLVATAWRLHLPGTSPGPAARRRLGRPPGAWAAEEVVPAERARELLGRRGLLAAEPATRLALCAVHRALGLPSGGRPGGSVSPDTAVVACGCLGNVETVARAARTIDREGARAVSVLDAPNVSPNVIAASVARWFGFGGPNLMVASGPAAGLDGLRLAGLLLRAGRASRVVLVGAEPDDAVAAALHGGPAAPLRAGAACMVLRARRPAEPARLAEVELMEGTGPAGPPPAAVLGPAAPRPGFYGAQGVIGLALAAHLAADEGLGPVAVRGPDEDRTALVEAVSGGRRGTR